MENPINKNVHLESCNLKCNNYSEFLNIKIIITIHLESLSIKT